jgi:transglutaminase-like putative cysteine protease
MFAYRAAGLDFGGEWADPELAGELRARSGTLTGDDGYPQTLLAVPAGAKNAAVLDAIMAEVTGSVRLPAAEFARRASAWLAQHHRYSTRTNVPTGAEDVLVRWLGSTVPGHCELFAGGFTLLARRAGFPTRVVTGFAGGDWNAFEQYYMVRNSDAHAWCEIYDERGCWVRVDPTSGAEGTAAPTTEAAPQYGIREEMIARGWEARLDALRMLWYRRIVSFDHGSQEKLVDSVKWTTQEYGRKLLTRLDRWGIGLRDWLLRPWNFGRLARWCGVAAMVAAVCSAAWHWRFLWWLRWTRHGRREDPVRREAGRWLRRFAQCEVPANGSLVIEELERLRYGPRTGRPSPLAVFTRAKRVLRTCR